MQPSVDKAHSNVYAPVVSIGTNQRNGLDSFKYTGDQSQGDAARNTRKCDIEKLTPKAATIEINFAIRTPQ